MSVEILTSGQRRRRCVSCEHAQQKEAHDVYKGDELRERYEGREEFEEPDGDEDEEREAHDNAEKARR